MVTNPLGPMTSITSVMGAPPPSKAIAALGKIVNELTHERETTFRNLPSEQLDEIDRVLSGLMVSMRVTRRGSKNRAVKSGERAVLNKFAERFDLKLQWIDHLSARDAGESFMLISEPYGLDPEDFKEISILNDNGWTISVEDQFGTYFPGRACCVLIRPPSKGDMAVAREVERFKRKAAKVESKSRTASGRPGKK